MDLPLIRNGVNLQRNCCVVLVICGGFLVQLSSYILLRVIYEINLDKSLLTLPRNECHKTTKCRAYSCQIKFHWSRESSQTLQRTKKTAKKLPLQCFFPCHVVRFPIYEMIVSVERKPSNHDWVCLKMQFHNFSIEVSPMSRQVMNDTTYKTV